MRMSMLLILVVIALGGCTGGNAETPTSGDTVSTVPKMSREEARQYGNLLPGKQSGEK